MWLTDSPYLQMTFQWAPKPASVQIQGSVQAPLPPPAPTQPLPPPRLQAFLLDPSGSSQLCSIAVSQCVFATSSPTVLMCQRVQCPLRVLHCVPLGATEHTRTLSEWVGGRCIDYCQDCVVWDNHLHKFYIHSNFPFYMSGKYL